MQDFAAARQTMVDCQLRPFEVTDRAVLAAFSEAERERFVPSNNEALAYTDRETPLGNGRAMTAPMVLARMIQVLRVEARHRVLEVGSGLGYGAEILRRLGADVVALENEGAFVEAARVRLPASVKLRTGPLAEGVAGASFARILVNGSLETRPERLIDQLEEDGRLICVMAPRGRAGKATLFVRARGIVGSTELFEAHAPPLADWREPPAFVF